MTAPDPRRIIATLRRKARLYGLSNCPATSQEYTATADLIERLTSACKPAATAAADNGG